MSKDWLRLEAFSPSSPEHSFISEVPAAKQVSFLLQDEMDVELAETAQASLSSCAAGRSRSRSPASEEDGSDVAHSDLASIEEKIDGSLTVSPRQGCKCRSKPDAVAWFEMASQTLFAEPQVSVDSLEDFEDGDLFVNWLDNQRCTCQIWRYSRQATGKISWRIMSWGSRRGPGSEQRLVITAKGYPSFVAESTWKKKYKSARPRIQVSQS